MYGQNPKYKKDSLSMDSSKAMADVLNTLFTKLETGKKIIYMVKD